MSWEPVRMLTPDWQWAALKQCPPKTLTWTETAKEKLK